MAFFEKIIHRFNLGLRWLAGIALLITIILTLANIILRPFGLPIRGTFEFVGFLGALVICFALGYTQIRKGNIYVEILITRISEPYASILQVIFHFLSFAVMTIAAWQTGQYATTIWFTGQLSDTMRIPYFPVIYAVSLGFAGLALVLLVDFLKLLIRIINK